MADARPRLAPSALANLGIVYLIWGSTFLAMRVGVRPGSGFAPWSFGGVRIALATVLLFGLAAILGHTLRIPTPERRALFASGLFIWVTGHGFLLWAEQWADSGYTALFIASFPIWAALYDSVLDKRLPSRVMAASLILGFLGIVALSIPQLGPGADIPPLALAALVVAPIGWAAGFTIQRRSKRTASSFVATAYQHLASFPVFFVIALIVREPTPAPSTDAWLALGYLVVFGSVVAFSAAVHALHNLPARIAMTYAYVNPVVALVLGHLLLNEPIGLWSLVGAALVVVGVYGVFWESLPRRTRTGIGPHAAREE